MNAERFGSAVASAAGVAPSQAASAAAYWSTAIVGIQRPSLPTSSGPPGTNVGILPYSARPLPRLAPAAYR